MMQQSNRLWRRSAACLFLISAGAWRLSAVTLCPDGTVGNSGTDEAPVRLTLSLRPSGEEESLGVGVVWDEKSGRLFERGSRTTLHAYALDGRLCGTFPLPPSQTHVDMLMRTDSHLILLLNGKLYRLALDAPYGSKPEPVAFSAGTPAALSASARNGRIAVLTSEGALLWFNLETGDAEKLCQFGQQDVRGCKGMDFDDRGDFYFFADRMAYKFVAGKRVESAAWPRRYIGDREGGASRMRFLDGFWYGSSYHGTIKRFNREIEPAPGVVLGGASGHFIGYAPCNYDADESPGMALIKPDLFAISGIHGIVQLAAYRPATKKLELLRRIGSLPLARPLALDGRGRLLYDNRIWEYGRPSQSPADFTVVFKGCGTSVAHFDDRTIIYPGLRYGKQTLNSGMLDEMALESASAPGLALPKETVGLALYRARSADSGAWRLLALGADGTVTLNEVSQEARDAWRKALEAPRLRFASPGKRYTALTGTGDSLFVACDGMILALARDGEDWKEVGRFGEGLGSELRLACSGTRLLVSDAKNDRLLLMDQQGKTLATTSCPNPGHVDFVGKFVAVWLPDQQRVVRYRIEE